MTASLSKQPAAVIDASVLIGFCAKEPGKFEAARSKIQECLNRGWRLFAPGVLIAEVLHVLCRKQQESVLDSSGYSDAMAVFAGMMSAIEPPPLGDALLIARAEQIRGTFSCNRSNDSIYLALAEQLGTDRTAALVTFDARMKSQAEANAASVIVEVLTVTPLSA